MCSTPFGITEVGISQPAAGFQVESVLNAFRHHRGGHLGWVLGGPRQRFVLNAFRHHRGGHLAQAIPPAYTE